MNQNMENVKNDLESDITNINCYDIELNKIKQDIESNHDNIIKKMNLNDFLEQY